VVGKPTDLKIIDLLSEAPTSATSKVEGTFWLTPNAMLSPWYSRKLSYTGDITVDRSKTFEFTLSNGLHLIFKHHYRYLTGENGETISFPELNAEFEAEADIDEVGSWVEALDDFLMIASFAARQLCACVGWSAYQPPKHVKFYRRNIVIPQREKRHSFQDGLVESKDFKDFMDTAYKRFVGSQRNDLIRQALHRVLPREDGTLESSYLVYRFIETYPLAMPCVMLTAWLENRLVPN